MQEIKAVVTDLDGTLLDIDQNVSVEDMRTLHTLGAKGVIRIAATGRSIFSAQRVLNPDFPIDYLVFSTGCGVMDWKNGAILDHLSLNHDDIVHAATIFRHYGINFMIQHEIPHNHRFLYWHNGHQHPDFVRRCKLYKGYCSELDEKNLPHKACQFVGITDEKDNLFQEILHHFTLQRVIRSTSPLDHKSVWIEIFPKQVSKAYGLEFLSTLRGFTSDECIALGNDYNDLDMLRWAGEGYMVANAPDEIRTKFKQVNNHCTSPLTDMCSRYFSPL